MRIPPGLIIGVVAAIVVVSGITLVATGAVSFGKNPKEILIESIEKSNSIKDYAIVYDIKNSVDTGGEDIKVGGNLVIKQSGEKRQVIYDFDLLGSRTKIEIYQTPEGSVTCSSALGQRQCQKLPITPPVQSPVEQQEQLKKQLDEGVVTLSYTGQSSLVDRSCDSIRAVYDVPKLIRSAELEIEIDATAIKAMVLDACLDSITGLPLSTDLVINIASQEVSGSVRTTLKATSFSLQPGEIVVPEAADAQPMPPLGTATLEGR